MLVLIGHDNYVNSGLISTVLRSDGLQVKKLRQDAHKRKMLINATAGHKARSVIVLTTNQVVLCALQSGMIRERVDEVMRG